ncbi:hypothetical protein MIMGU_mgv1a005534mg [Erythranthe guttata]|uniref:Uncharacterized protein n=1 Tax=Erythranthe guttata TaxID=4155 RepID=A0A022Q422_ERYGU|nr:hypothetical protein MIMGU_mgv1a005534mg [Erythranthe guttata]
MEMYSINWESSLLLATLLLFLALITISKKLQQPQRLINPPPGPKPWPVIGNLNLIISKPRQSLQSLSEKYGEILLLKLGKSPVVIASSPELAKQFLRTHDASFASRPAFAAGKYTCYNYRNMVWAPYGPYWKQARRIYHSEVFSAKRLESFEHIRVQERRRFLSRLHSLSEKPIMLRDELSRHTLSSISKMVLSGNGLVKKMKILHKKLDCFNNYVIDDHLARRSSSEKPKHDFATKGVLDVLLELAEDSNNLDVQLTRDDIKGLLQDLLTGGTDSSATTVEWAIHELLRQPRIIEKAKEELDRVIGRNRWVEENDYSRLPYIEAIIMESMRLHPLSTFLAPRYAVEDCKVAGFDISKGTIVLVNIWSIGRDPKSWDSPREFLPERFLGKEMLDVVMGSDFEMLPFGSGRRRCPGYSLGLRVVRATLASLLHGFDLKLAADGRGGVRADDICMEDMSRFDTRPKHPILVVLEPRLEHHLY